MYRPPKLPAFSEFQSPPSPPDRAQDHAIPFPHIHAIDPLCSGCTVLSLSVKFPVASYSTQGTHFPPETRGLRSEYLTVFLFLKGSAKVFLVAQLSTMIKITKWKRNCFNVPTLMTKTCRHRHGLGLWARSFMYVCV